MREIKFRFWDNEEKRMIGPDLSPFQYKIASYNGLSLIDYEREDEDGYPYEMDVEFLQYTGLKDRNGKEIYEGDILRITYTDWEPYIGRVEYGLDRDYPAYDLEPWIDCGMNALAWLKSESDPSVVSYEVIGNIYENPELLEGGTGA